MIRLYVSEPLLKDIVIALDDKAQHYLLHVMRQHDGDVLLCFNGTDGEWKCRLTMTGKKKAVLQVLEQTRPQTQPEFCAICPALIKKDNMDIILQKATELGVTDIYPILSEHTSHPHFNMPHALAVVKEAAEQCERLTLPVIHSPMPLVDLSKNLPSDCACYYLAERQAASSLLPERGPVAFVVGPEGGWSEKENLFFQKSDFIPLHFDVGILRAETACIAILSCWQIGRHLQKK